MRTHTHVFGLLLVLAGLALTGCLPLQFGVEGPPTSTAGATRVSQAGGTDSPQTPPAVDASATHPPVASTPTVFGAFTVTPSLTQATATGTLAATAAASFTAHGTATARPTTTPVRIECTLTHVVQTGERLFQIGALYGVDWRDIASLNDLDNPGLIHAGQVLCLPADARTATAPPRTPTPSATPSATLLGQASTATLTPTPSLTPELCQDPPPWFFTPAPAICPTAAAITSQAAAERFEHGLMLWVAAVDRYFVLYDGAPSASNDLTYLPGPLTLRPGASVDNRVPETPPPGLEQPVSGFGLIWRAEVAGSDGVRAGLGWATQSEFSYTTTYQCQASASAQLDCYLRAPDGRVLRLYFSGSGYLWQEI